MTVYWKPGFTRDATHRLSGDGWAVWSCQRDLTTAQAVTGDRPARGRGGQGSLFEMQSGGS